MSLWHNKGYQIIVLLVLVIIFINLKVLWININRQYNKFNYYLNYEIQLYVWRYNDLQNITQKTKYRSTQTTLKSCCKLRSPGRVNSSCFTCGNHCLPLLKLRVPFSGVLYHSLCVRYGWFWDIQKKHLHDTFILLLK